MQISNSDFWILAGILSTIGGIGIHEGNELHPVFYTQPAIIFGTLGYFGYKTFYLDRRHNQQ
jgi:hypothetical protein